jgi:exodeoxyribonuclease V alpha subunit
MTHTYRITVTRVHRVTPHGAIFTGVTLGEDGHTIRMVTTGTHCQPIRGDVYDVVGRWQYETPYGWQLHGDASLCARRRLSGALILPYLRAHLPGIGTERAARLLATFGDTLGEVLGDPQRLGEIAQAMHPTLSAFALRLAVAIHHRWHDLEAEFTALAWLEARGVADPRLARLLVRILGANTASVLSRNPYIMATVLRWPDLDVIGRQVLQTEHGITDPCRSPQRLLGALDSVIQDAIGQGHTAIRKTVLPQRLAQKLALPIGDPAIADAIRLGVRNNGVVEARDLWRAPGCALMEDELEHRFQGMVAGKDASAVHPPSDHHMHDLVHRVLRRERLQLHEEQSQAVCHVLRHGLSILTGGAGTGKTTTLTAICAVWEALGGRIELAALSGKAALRLSQATGRRAWTIYRLLHGLEEQQRVLTGLEALPALDDGTLLIIDEASMVDLGQWYQIVEAMPPGCRLLMVGDVAQLPPIGFGLVFHRLAEDTALTARLETIHRQTDASGIPQVADAVRQQQWPCFRAYRGAGEGVSFLEAPTPSIPQVIETVVADLGPFSATEHALQIVAALNEGEAGVFGLNRRFHGHHTADGRPVIKGFLGQYFAVGDPIIHTRNDYREALYNGSLGHVVAVDPPTRSLIARFDAAEKTFDTSRLLDLQLAYAITCHRAQGSQATRIIVPLLRTHLLEPTWLYTAITRAEQQCVLVGEGRVLAEALRRPPQYTTRVVGGTFQLHTALRR